RCCVLTEQRSLRTAKYFDLLDINEIKGCRRWPRIVHTVNIEADTRINAVVGQPESRSMAADIQRPVTRVGRVELNGVDKLLHAVNVESTSILSQFARYDRDRDRNILDGLLTTTRRDYDLGEKVIVTQGQLQRLVGKLEYFNLKGLEPRKGDPNRKRN